MPAKNELIITDESGKSLVINTANLDLESLDILNKAIVETDIEKSKDLTNMFNLNQNKKAMVRVNKLSQLLDTITDAAIKRFSNPDEVTTEEMLKGMKTVQDSLERGQNQINGISEKPIIQINNQDNSVNVGDNTLGLNKESRDRVQRLILNVLNSSTNKPIIPVEPIEPIIVEEVKKEETNGN